MLQACSNFARVTPRCVNLELAINGAGRPAATRSASPMKALNPWTWCQEEPQCAGHFLRDLVWKLENKRFTRLDRTDMLCQDGEKVVLASKFPYFRRNSCPQGAEVGNILHGECVQ
eukprot:5667234-Amphidinium_carterae.1